MLIFSSLRKTKFLTIFFRLQILFFFRIFALPKATRRLDTHSLWRLLLLKISLLLNKQNLLTDL